MPAKKSVVITGASTGIGRACALHMDRLGWRVFAGIRQGSDAASLRAEGSNTLTPLFLDVTNAESVREAQEAVERSVGALGLSGLVNNAGVAYGGPVEFLELDEVRKAFEVNLFGVIAVTQAFLPLLRRGLGRVVNMSSISGWVASPFLSPYSTSKFALEALSDALRVEVHRWRIGVAVIEPGAIDTPIWSKGGQIVKHLIERASPEAMELYSEAIQNTESGLKPHGIPAEHVARAVAHALTARRPKTRYAVGPDAPLVDLFRRLPDRVRDAYFIAHLPNW
jgi:NAD(P)-dependent dehydrogenase (short-subunit alcohol dehydrogenase family)